MSQDERLQLSQDPSLYTKYIEPIVLLIFMIAAALYVPVMVLLFGAGILEAGKGALGFYSSAFHLEQGAKAGEAELIGTTIRGIELLLLAPLGYFLLVSLAIYAKTCRQPGIDHDAHGKLLSVKALSIGLLIGVIAADMVGRVLTADGISYKAAICESLAIGMLTGYFFVIEKLVIESAAEGVKRGEPDTETTVKT